MSVPFTTVIRQSAILRYRAAKQRHSVLGLVLSGGLIKQTSSFLRQSANVIATRSSMLSVQIVMAAGGTVAGVAYLNRGRGHRTREEPDGKRTPAAEIAPWFGFGLCFNSSVLVSADLIDAVFARRFALAPLAAAGAGATVVGGASLIMLQVLPGAMKEPEPGALKLRMLGLATGLLVGLFPIAWPQRYRLWRAGAAATRAKKTVALTPGELQVLKHCKTKFPTACLSRDVDGPVTSALKELGWNDTNTLFAHASCPDEVNYDGTEDIVNVFHRTWGQRFSLGGLAGMAFSGKTGWGAFGAHTTKEGKILVLYGPHVGVGNDGTVGNVHRFGQDADSTCCGAAVAAYNTEELPTNDAWTKDMHQIALTKMLHPFRPVIAADPEPMKALAYANFEISHNYLKNLINNPEDACDEIAVVGGIMVNLPGALEDRFVPLTFEHLDCRTGTTHDLFHRLKQDRVRNVFGERIIRSPFFEDTAKRLRDRTTEE